jgi:hypothetical protein
MAAHTPPKPPRPPLDPSQPPPITPPPFKPAASPREGTAARQHELCGLPSQRAAFVVHHPPL